MSVQRKTINPTTVIAIGGVVLALICLVVSKHPAANAWTVTRPNGEDPAQDDAHGRLAMIPEEIPAPGLRDVFWRVMQELSQDRVAFIAAGVAFYLLLALFPALAALVSLYGLIADPAAVSDHMRDMAGVLPPGAFDILADQLQQLVLRRETTLGVAFFVGLAIAIWSTHNGTLAIFDAMNVAYEETEKRGFVRLNIVALAFTVCAMIAAIVTIGIVALLPAVLEFVWLDPWKETLALMVRWPLLLALVFSGMTAIYRFGPSRQPAKLRWLTWGAVLATAGWLLMAFAFSWYVETFADYNAAYGALSGLVGLLMWIWLSICVLIVGAELNAELEHQTAKDTTTGPARPLGTRGAHMADTIGRSVH
jgi:membrane protein